MQRMLLSLLVLLLLGGCSSMNPIDWIAPDEITNPPTELQELTNQIRLRQLWSGSLGNGMDEQWVKLVLNASDQQLFAADREGEVAAFDISSGRQLWKIDTGLILTGGPGVGEELVLMGTSDGEILALDPLTGEEQWRARVSSEVLSVPVAALGVVVVHTVDGKLFGLDAESGRQIWLYDRTVPVLTLHGSGTPVISGSYVITGFSSGKLVSIDLISGDLQWEVSVAIPKGRSELERMVDLDGDPLIFDGVIYVNTYQGQMAAIAEDTGVVLWRRDLSAYAGAAADWGQIYATDSQGQVWGFEPQNGSAVWKNKRLMYRRLSPPAVQGDYVVVGDFEGYLHWLSREDGRLVARARVGSEPISSAPYVLDDTLYVYGDGGQLAAFAIDASGDL